MGAKARGRRDRGVDLLRGQRVTQFFIGIDGDRLLRLRFRFGCRLRFRAAGDPAEKASGKLTPGVIREELARIVRERSAQDPRLHYLDGRELYGEADFGELPLPDDLHPDAAAHRRIGERFAALAFAPKGPFADGVG